MERIVYRITLDSHKTGIQRTLQGFETADNMARTIAVNITASGDTYEIPLDNVVAMMYVTTPNASEPSINECRIEDNTIYYDVLPIVEEGITEMKIKLIETSVDGAKRVLLAPKFVVEVTESGTEDDSAEQTTTFTALENAIAKAHGVYDQRLLNIEIGPDCVFRAIYADGTVYENHYLHEALYNGNALLSESWAKGGTGIRENEETNNSKYFSNVSKSSSIEASASADMVRGLVDMAKLYSTYTSFDTNFKTGELEYISASHNFDVNEETGELEVEGELFDPTDVLEKVADDYLDEKTQEISKNTEDIDSVEKEVTQLKSDLSEKNFKSYYSLEQIGVTTDVSEVTMTEILNAMPPYSEFIARINTSWNRNEFPNLYTTLHAVKHEDYERCYAFLISTNSGAFRFGSMNSGDATFSGWKSLLTEDGGTLSGALVHDNPNALGQGLFQKNSTSSADYGTEIRDYDKDGRIAYLRLSALNNVVRFIDTGGVSHNLYGEHNKPSGTYTGNGSETERYIDTGGIIGKTPIVYIYCSSKGTNALMGGASTICWQGSTMKSIPVTNGEILRDGRIKLTTTDAFLNENGKTYEWYLL